MPADQLYLLGKPLEILLRIHVLAGLFANMEFFINEITGKAFVGQVGKFRQILLDLPRQTVMQPAVLQVDLDCFQQRQTPQRTCGIREEIADRRGRIFTIPSRDKPLNMPGQ